MTVTDSILDMDLAGDAAAGAGVPIRNNEGRARSAILMLWIIFGIDVAILSIFFLRFYLLRRAMNGIVTEDEANANNLLTIWSSYLYIVAFIVSCVMFIRWFRRAYYNLHLLDGSYLSYSEGYASGAWFIPFFNLFAPYRIMKEISHDTGHHAQKVTGSYFDTAENLVSWWWTLWICERILAIVLRILSDNNLYMLQINTIVVITSYGFNLFCALLAIRIIRRISKAEAAMYENRGRLVPATEQSANPIIQPF